MKKSWKSPVYAFFEPDVKIAYESKGGVLWKYHVFSCAGGHCTTSIRRYLDTKDAQSTSNMRKHVVKCWGREVLAAAEGVDDMGERRRVANEYLRTGKITTFFKRRSESRTVTYSVIQHTKAEIRYVAYCIPFYHLLTSYGVYHSREIALWCAESSRPFAIVKDQRLLNLLKTGRPEYAVPSPTTVSRDVRKIFEHTKARLATILQVSICSQSSHIHPHIPFIELQRGPELRHRCVDVTKSPCICGIHCPFRAPRKSDQFTAGFH
jgi:hypothetical protein